MGWRNLGKNIITTSNRFKQIKGFYNVYNHVGIPDNNLTLKNQLIYLLKFYPS